MVSSVSAMRGPERGGGAVGIAVPVDVGERLPASASTNFAGGGSGDSLVLSRTATSTWGEW